MANSDELEEKKDNVEVVENKEEKTEKVSEEKIEKVINSIKIDMSEKTEEKPVAKKNHHVLAWVMLVLVLGCVTAYYVCPPVKKHTLVYSEKLMQFIKDHKDQKVEIKYNEETKEVSENVAPVEGKDEVKVPEISEDIKQNIINEVNDKTDELARQIALLNMNLSKVEKELSDRIKTTQEMMPKTGLIEDNLRALTAKSETTLKQVIKNTQQIEDVERNKADASYALSLSSRMTIVEHKLASSNAIKEKAVALMLSIFEIRRAVETGRPFAVELQTAIATATVDSELELVLRKLKPVANDGIKSERQLFQDFSEYEQKAIYDLTQVAETTWYKAALNKIRGLVVIRRIDAAPTIADDTKSIIANAVKAVEDRNLSLALENVRKLKGKSADIFEPWSNSAEVNLSVQDILSEALTMALGQIYATGDEK